MKTLLRYLPTALVALLLAACGDDSEYFYTTAYPIVRIDAVVTLEAVTPPDTGEETGGGEPGDDTGGETGGGETGGGETGGESGGQSGGESEGETGGETDGETDGGETPEDPMIRQIKDEVIAGAPVQASGSYSLAFKYFDSGRLTVRTSAGSEPLSGGFYKQPGATQVRFFYGDDAYVYTLDSYTSEEGVEATLLRIDLTESYQALYPDAGITKVERLEYTSLRK